MKKARVIIDFSMMILLLMLMAYSLIGETLHEIVGTLIFVLFIVHHIINRKWTSALFKGKYKPVRIFQTVINVLIFIVMILQPVSGILLSKHLFTFLPIMNRLPRKLIFCFTNVCKNAILKLCDANNFDK